MSTANAELDDRRRVLTLDQLRRAAGVAGIGCTAAKKMKIRRPCWARLAILVAETGLDWTGLDWTGLD